MASVTLPTDGTNNENERRASPQWARRYPPMLSLVVAFILALVVLPSSLNLPQANPSTTLELAPVPPQDDKAPPPTGNENALGLASSSSLNGGGAAGGAGAGSAVNDPLNNALPPGGQAPLTKSKTPSTKRCVQQDGGVKQTEDPLAPPCVANFEGDNGGATYQGVTKDEVRILIYHDGNAFDTPTARGTDNAPQSKLIDLDAPPEANEIARVFTFRAWEHYFNDRYQLYGRRAHMFVYFGSVSATNGIPSPDTRQADAAQAYAKVHPFAVISYASLGGNADAFLKYMASHGVLNFGSVEGRTQQFFDAFPKLVWGYPPSLEEQARGFIDYVCKQIVPFKTSFTGNSAAPAVNNVDRKLGIVYTNDPAYPGLQVYEDAVEKGIRACGGNIVDKVTYPTNGYTTDTSTTPSYAVNNMTELQSKGVTTIIWPGGIEIKQSQQATNISYFPEWVISGDLLQDAVSYGQKQDQRQWAHAWLVSNTVKTDVLQKQLCYAAYREVDSGSADSDIQNFACNWYNDLRQLFTGLQVAGRLLGPSSVDKGFHAIPSVESKDPRVPACFYESNDYTCVKDSVAEWWDTASTAPNFNSPGCWRMAETAKRYIFGTYPKRDAPLAKNAASDPCNGYDTTEFINAMPPSGP